MIGRMLRAARFDARLYQELQADPTATVQALAVVLLSGLSLGIAGVIGFYGQEGLGAQSLVLTRTITAALAGWVVLSLLGLLVGQLLNKPIAFPALLRAIGFANAPGLLYILIMIGGTMALLTNAAILLWTLLAMTVALRNTLLVSLLPSFLLAVIGTVIYIIMRNMTA
ncbi:MAG: hypothetical protein EXR53_02805 [Dehalococcoidia bacterium]|nr:hypothetical protein [Dehalococcoidia bacterium]